MSIRVVVCDPHILVRTGLRTILSSQVDIEVAGEASNGAQAAKAGHRLRPCVVIVDLYLPGLEHIQAVQQPMALQVAKPVSIVALADGDDEEEKVLAVLQLGARGLVGKDDPRELVKAIRATAAGQALLAPRFAGQLLDRLTSALPAVGKSPEWMAELSERERSVVRLVARGLNNKEIATALSISSKTVKYHVSNVLAKLALRDRAQIIVLSHTTADRTSRSGWRAGAMTQMHWAS